MGVRKSPTPVTHHLSPAFMPINARWRKLETLPPKRGRDAQPGIYELADEEKNIIYIGQSATDVPNRIRQHLEKNDCVIEKLVYWRYQYSRVPQADEAKHIDLYVKRSGDLPPCNTATPKTRDLKRRWLERSSSRD
jgi:predicted GIY-YIG superfamily endonuclease